jgi:two-component system nitrate/nitrite sensor histidine kinase NarX
MQTIIERLNKVILDIRFFIQDLKLPQDYQGDLGQNLEEQLQRFSYITQISAELSVRGEVNGLLTGDQLHHLNFIVQETLANVAKHAEASQVFVRLAVDADRLRLLIADDGQGIRELSCTQALLSGNGMKNIRARAAELHGQVGWESYPGMGTVLHLTIPVGPSRSN